MSVINKMLRDLDERRATTLPPSLRVGTQVVRAQTPAGHSSRRFTLGVAVALGAAVAAGGVWWVTTSPTPLPPVPPTVAVPAVAVAVAPLAPGSAAAAAASIASAASQPGLASAEVAAPPIGAAPRGAASAASQAGLQLTASVWGVTPKAAVTQAAAPAPMPASIPNPAPVALRSAAVLANAAPVAPAAPDPAVLAQRQQQASRDALVQAQSLYGSGSADAAIALLQEALAVSERAAPPAPAAVQQSLVRELARMELAQGRAAAVLELLARVEPLLAGQADLWAVRANAAQRLGRHQDAVQFYATALQTRPAEQRWLLGSAVSLAALGQLGNAAELAEKARSVGPVSKEVATYLRQQGVVLADK